MKRNTRKGFTGIELVIVIAIIAILAATLIPTFGGLFKSAKLTNDKSFVRNANATLLAEGLANKFKTAGDAIDALNTNGFAGKYNTYSKNYHYCYSLEKNQMYLIDDNGKVVFPAEEVEVSTLWGLYTDNRTSITAGVTKYVAMCNIRNSEHFNAVFASGTYTIDLNGYMIAVDSTVNGVTAQNGIVIKGATAGEGANTEVKLVPESGTTGAESNAYYKNLGTTSADGTITISNKVITERVYLHPAQNIVFNHCIFYGYGVNIDDISGYTGYKVTFNDCQFTDISSSNWAILTHGSVEVNNCTFTNLQSRGAIQLHENSENITVKISGCTFDGVNNEYPIIRFVGRDSRIDADRATSVASLEISGCNFTALNKAKGVIGFSGTGSAFYSVAGQPEATFENNKFAEEIEGKYVVGAAEGNNLGDRLAASAK